MSCYILHHHQDNSYLYYCLDQSHVLCLLNGKNQAPMYVSSQ